MPSSKSILSSPSQQQIHTSLQAPTTRMDLPVALTAQILGHVPLADRLTQCALVCRAWASAAALATTRVQHKLRPDAIPTFENWLRLHAGQLLTLQLQGRQYDVDPLHLPLHSLNQLQQLELDGPTVRLPGETAGSQHRGQAWQWPNLQDMRLSGFGVADISSLLQLTRAPQLTRLEVLELRVAEVQFNSSSGWEVIKNTVAAVQPVAAALPRMLQQLPQLSVLQLPGMPVTDAALREMRRLQGLRQVTLNHMQHVPCDLQLLPGSITRLDLIISKPIERDPWIRLGLRQPDSSLPAQLPQLTALVHLSLQHCHFNPTVLGSFKQLQTLRLDGCGLLPKHLDDWGDSDEDDAEPQTDTDGTATLLDILPKLTCLRQLDLHLAGQLPAVTSGLQRLSALTASSQLTALWTGCQRSSKRKEAAGAAAGSACCAVDREAHKHWT